MDKPVYIRLRHRVQVKPRSIILLDDITQIIAPEEFITQLKDHPIYKVRDEDQNIIVIDIMMVIREITSLLTDADVQAIGPTQVIIEVVRKRRSITWPLFMFVWLLLFFGAALTIMNFHEDVSMRIVQQRIYHILTGTMTEKPLLFQIPYSIGLGVGMILFFNHLFKKRLNEEPSPLEVEMFNYQMDLDHYVSLNENEESMKKIDDD